MGNSRLDAWGSNFERVKQTIPSSQDMQINTARLERVETMLSEINSKLELMLDTMTRPAQQSAPAVSVETKAEADVTVNNKSTIERIKRWVDEQPGQLPLFKRRASAGFVSARLSGRTQSATASQRHTHQIEIRDQLTRAKYNPSIFSVHEAREVVAYLESLGVKVKTNKLI
jgi:hypothetical protein